MPDTEPVRVAFKISIGLSNAYQEGEYEIDRDEWDRMTPDAREEMMDEIYQETITDYLDGGRWAVNADVNDPVKDD